MESSVRGARRSVIIVFNGPPGSGKDQACDVLSKTSSFAHLSFKEQLFKETFKYFGVSKGWFMKGYNDRSVKEMPVPQLKVNGKKLSRRQAMIHVSENYLKPKYGKSIFGDKLVSEMCGKDQTICVSDGGFSEELQPIINRFGIDDLIVVQLTREGCNFSGDSRRYLQGNLVDQFILGHETFIDSQYIIDLNIEVPTYRIHNNDSVERFNQTVLKVYKKAINDRKENKTQQVRAENTT